MCVRERKGEGEGERKKRGLENEKILGKLHHTYYQTEMETKY